MLHERCALREPAARSKSWPRDPSVRRRFHRTFLRWHAANAGRFVVHLEWLRRTDQVLTLGFHSINGAVTADVASDEINVNVHWEGEFWDALLWVDASPIWTRDGYVCELCPEGTRQTYPSRDALWAAEIFDPFLAWVNGTLANAEAIILSGEPGRWTSARLEPGK